MANKSAVVRFCPIDAKDNVDCGYEPVAFSGKDGPVQLGRLNGRLHVTMRREYLVRLGALQDEIAAKYGPLFVDHDDVADDELWGAGLNKARYDEAERYAVVMFPGREAEYYT